MPDQPSARRTESSSPPPETLESGSLRRMEIGELTAPSTRNFLRELYRRAPTEEIAASMLLKSIGELLPRWAAGASLSFGQSGIRIELPDSITVDATRVRAATSKLESTLEGQVEIVRSARFIRTEAVVKELLGEGADFLLKLDAHNDSMFVIMAARPRAELEVFRDQLGERTGLRAHICALVSKSKFFTVSPANSSQSEIEAVRAKALQRLIRGRMPRWCKTGISVSTKGVELHWYGKALGVGREQHIRSLIGRITDLPVSIRLVERADNPKDAISNSAPAGVSIWHSSFFRVELGNKEYRCAVVKASIPREKESDVLRWRLALEERFGVHIILHAENLTTALNQKIQRIADADGIVRDPAKVHALARSLLGASPRPRPRLVAPPQPTHGVQTLDPAQFQFITVDPAETVDPEDALWAKSAADGSIRVIVAYADASWHIDPHSEEAEHARRLIQTSYRKDHHRPMLGSHVDLAEMALMPGKERLAWIVDMRVNEYGAVEKYQFYRARMTVAAAFDHDTFNATQHITSDPLLSVHSTLMLAARRLQAHRSKQRGSMNVSGDITSHRLVEAFNIVAREKIAHYFARRNIPIPFSVLGRPSKRKLDALISEIRSHGETVERNDFGDPERFSALFERLVKKDSTRQIGHQMLDTFLLRSRFSSSSAPHSGLPADQYLQVKALRTYAGLLFQWQAHRYFQRDASQPLALLSREFIEREVKHINRRRSTAWQNFMALSMLSSLRRRLETRGQKLRAIIENVADRSASVYIPRFGIEAVVSCTEEQTSALRIGSSVRIALEGLDSRSMLYRARLIVPAPRK